MAEEAAWPLAARLAGADRVEIRWYPPTGKQKRDAQDTGETIEKMAQVVPSRYNQQSGLTADVSESQTKFDFELSAAKYEGCRRAPLQHLAKNLPRGPKSR